MPPSESSISASSGVTSLAKEKTVVRDNAHSFAFRDISLTVSTSQGRQQLLSSLEGVVRGGRLTALMGSSGAGKTTLLNTLAQRSISGGIAKGAIHMNGQPLLKSFRRRVGYAEQMDLHEETSTVLEAVRFSALLRQPATITIAEKYAYCDEVLELLELRDVSNAVIGIPGRGLNSETRKMVTIAVELAAKPDTLLFLDEPTSGLDSAAAFNVVRALKKLADSGLAILCTVHQPSSNLLGLFDDLLLLAPGGRCVYNGALGGEGRQMINYFEGNGAIPCVSGENPGKCSGFLRPWGSSCSLRRLAEWMLTTIGAGDPSYRGPDWAEVWKLSEECKTMAVEVERAMNCVPPATDLRPSPLSDDSGYYSASLGTQALAVLKRAFVAQWRKPEYVYGKIIMHVVSRRVCLVGVTKMATDTSSNSLAPCSTASHSTRLGSPAKTCNYDCSASSSSWLWRRH